MARSIRPQSAASIELTRRIWELRQAGVSAREVARRTGISKSQVSAIELGTRRASEKLAAPALARLGNAEFAERRAIVNGEVVWVAPLHRRDFEKWGRWSNAVAQARREGDYRIVRRVLKRSDLSIRVVGEGGAPRTVRLEGNPAALQQLDDEGRLPGGEVSRGPSPQAGSARAAA